MSSTVHFGKGRSMTFKDPAYVDTTMARPTAPLLTEHLAVKLDRHTHAKLKRLATDRQKSMADLVREKIVAEIEQDERDNALAPRRSAPWATGT